MRRVPSQVNLEAMKREARNLLHALRQRDPAALRRYHSIDPLAGLSQPSLADVKYIIAHNLIKGGAEHCELASGRDEQKHPATLFRRASDLCVMRASWGNCLSEGEYA